jgi:hypothetical protein
LPLRLLEDSRLLFPVDQSRRRQPPRVNRLRVQFLRSRRRPLLRCLRGRLLRLLHKAPRTLPLRLHKDSRLLFPADRSRRRRLRRVSHLRVQFLQSRRRPLHKAPRTLPLRLHKDSRLLFPADRPHRRLLRKPDRNRCRPPHQLGLRRHRRLVLRPTCRVPRSNAPACRHLRHSRRDRSRPQR